MSFEELATFEANRGRLFGLAYRMLGEATEAEDVLQDAYLRWRNAKGVERPEAWLTTVVTRLCLNRLDSARARRETYPGEWLPEPVDTTATDLGPMETVEQRESVSLGMLVLMERLSPPERGAFVLREAFGHSHREIAEILDVEEAYSRQLLRRARRHLQAGRRRFAADPQRSSELADRFFAATMSGDVAALEALLAADVVAWADGGGDVAARHPVVGRAKVARYLTGLSRHSGAAGIQTTVREINAQPALVATGGAGIAVYAAEFADERVVAVRIMVNQDKLSHLSP